MTTRFPRTLASFAVVTGFGLSVAACGQSGSTTGTSDEYPSEPITFLVPYEAGGPTDVTARALAPCLGDELGQPVVAENVPGGSGAVGLQRMIGEDADGHTLAIVSTGMVVLTPLVNKLEYSKEDITPIGVISRVPMNLVVGEDSEFQTVEDFIAAAEENPGQLNVGVSGSSTPQAIELQRLEDEHGVDLTVVPFEGSAGATTAVLGGHADAAFINDAPEVSERIEDGSFRVLLTSGEERQEHIPDTPTFVDLGYEDLTLAVTTYGLAGPAGLPEDVVSKASDALDTCLQDEQTAQAIGERFVPETYGTAEDLQRYLDEGAEVYPAIVGS
ncbi:tripartite-type tricarboxylate transporter receptor subunit TctC [Arthrobacter sp. CAN_A6]|uniref:tripartite tricarboxylate transporter substrate binding protein n=1 Tax=Arthrobacter sp. CAN_A6 TaxID=2787721 RepID=UPI0018C9C484